jgi:transcription-repair coupling factor (superfamily II helicase)
VIDEEQRFGVNHKVKLLKKHVNIDVLTLTATPIPRTLRQAMDGLVDISILETPPIERRPVIIEIVEPIKNRGTERLSSVLQKQPTKGARLPSISLVNFDAVARGLHKELERGGQSFVICPFIDNLSMYEREIKRRLPDIRIMTVHGRMGNIDENVEIFADGGADVLLATTVIENGLNLPQVNSIFIGEAER